MTTFIGGFIVGFVMSPRLAGGKKMNSKSKWFLLIQFFSKKNIFFHLFIVIVGCGPLLAGVGIFFGKLMASMARQVYLYFSLTKMT